MAENQICLHSKLYMHDKYFKFAYDMRKREIANELCYSEAKLLFSKLLERS